jgi:hypothetical protein
VDSFKNFGLINLADRKVLLNILLSNDDIPDIETGWHENITTNIVRKSNPCHVANLYGFYADMNADRLESRWFARMDDDTCTDVDNLISSLDFMYEWQSPFHLGDLNRMADAMSSNEGYLYPEYRHLVGEYDRVVPFMRNEVECGITSRAGLVRILGTERSRRLLEFRAGLTGGFGDCVVAIAAVMAGVHPLQCPFITHEPRIQEFSSLGGIYSHIHMIAPDGENFAANRRASSLAMELLFKSILKSPSEKEKMVMGSRYLMESEDRIDVYEFRPNYSLKIKFKKRARGWLERDGQIVVVNDGGIEHKFDIEDNGDLSGDFYLRRL